MAVEMGRQHAACGCSGGVSGKMTPEEAQLIKQLSEENSSTQKMLSEIRTMLSQFIKDQKGARRERSWQ